MTFLEQFVPIVATLFPKTPLSYSRTPCWWRALLQCCLLAVCWDGIWHWLANHFEMPVLLWWPIGGKYYLPVTMANYQSSSTHIHTYTYTHTHTHKHTHPLDGYGRNLFTLKLPWLFPLLCGLGQRHWPKGWFQSSKHPYPPSSCEVPDKLERSCPTSDSGIQQWPSSWES